MNVFISWSGPGRLSERAAEKLRDWLPLVLQSVRPWMSAKDIHAGARWSHELSRLLDECNFGLLCLTNESKNKPWLHFEASGLAKSLDDGCVVPVLIDLEPEDVPSPLAQFQCQRLDKAGMWCVVESLNRKLSEPVSLDRLRKSFEAFWPDLDEARQQMLDADRSGVHPNKSAQQAEPTRSDQSTQNILSRLDRLADAVLAIGPNASKFAPIPVAVNGASGQNSVAVTWFKDLIDVVETFQAELGAREYQLELRHSQDSAVYAQIQLEMTLAHGLLVEIRSLISKSQPTGAVRIAP